MPPRSHAPLPADDSLPPAPRPVDADALQGTLTQTIGDLAGIARWLPCASPEDADRASLLLTALAAECAEAATMCRALGTGKEHGR